MAIIEPNSEIYLLKSSIEVDDNHELDFANANAQFNYFYNLPKIGLNKCTYQRRDDTIRYNGGIEEILGYNYCMYRNKNHGNKWFYAFITGMTYLNDEVTSISIKEDPWQTWMFDIDFKQSFVEREHVNDDTIGKHTIPEGLELGEFQIVQMKSIEYDDYAGTHTHFVPCFCVTALPNGCSPTSEGRVSGDDANIGDVFNALKFFAVTSFDDAKKVIRAYELPNVTQTSDAIINIYMIPRSCVNYSQTNPTTLGYYEGSTYVTCTLYSIKSFVGSTSQYEALQQPTTLADNYTPVNKKLYISPFSYIYMSNNAGTDVTLNWEDFPLDTISGVTMPTITYYKAYVPSCGVSAKLIFKYYKNHDSDGSNTSLMINYGIPFAKAPICAWTTDYYTNWLTQNGVNNVTKIESSIMGAIGGTIAGAFTGGIVGAAAGAVIGAVSAGSTIGGVLAEEHKASTVPPQSQGDASCADLNFQYKKNEITCYFMSIRKEMAQVIDSYFSMFGYRINSVKVPNLTGRRNWNYVKTVDANIEGDIPQESLASIRNLFNKGITIWHNPNTFRDYSQNNSII